MNGDGKCLWKFTRGSLRTKFLMLKLKTILLHTNIIDLYNLSVRIIDLVSHTVYNVCVNFVPN